MIQIYGPSVFHRSYINKRIGICAQALLLEKHKICGEALLAIKKMLHSLIQRQINSLMNDNLNQIYNLYFLSVHLVATKLFSFGAASRK